MSICTRQELLFQILKFQSTVFISETVWTIYGVICKLNIFRLIQTFVNGDLESCLIGSHATNTRIVMIVQTFKKSIFIIYTIQSLFYSFVLSFSFLQVGQVNKTHLLP